MSTDTEKICVLNINRILIYLFSLLGLFCDFSWAYVIALTLWLWLPSCINLELWCLNYWKTQHLSVFSKCSSIAGLLKPNPLRREY